MSTATTRRCAAIARRTAAAAPDATLPCPECGAELKATNVDKHLSKVHSLEPTEEAGGTVVTGGDERMQYFTAILPALALLGLWPVTQTDPSMHRMAIGLWAIPFTLSCVPMVLAFMNKFRASVEVLADRVVLRSALGLLRREVTFPLTIATGSLEERQEDGIAKDGYGYRGPAELVKVGHYLELRGANGKHMVLGAPKSTHPLKYWDVPHEAGKARKIWDVNFKTDELGRLQYLLAEREILRPKGGSAA